MTTSRALRDGVLVLAMVLAGCTSQPPAVYTDPVRADEYPNIVALEGLRSWVIAAVPIVQSGPDQPLSVVVPLRSKAADETIVQYRFDFLDKDLRPIEPAMAWQVARLTRAQTMLKGSALDTNAADWRLVLRPAK